MSKIQNGWVFLSKSVALMLIIAFLSIKLVISLSLQEWLSHFIIALILLALPLSTNELRLPYRIIRAIYAKWSQGDAICLAYFLAPLLLNLIFLPQHWHSASFNWLKWSFSQFGLSSIIIASVAEELFFRGWLIDRQLLGQSSKKKMSQFAIFKICYVNALIFWFMHFPIDLTLWKEALFKGQIPASPGPFLLGMVCSYLSIRAGHLRPSILFHAIANSSGPLWWPLLSQDLIRNLFYQ